MKIHFPTIKKYTLLICYTLFFLTSCKTIKFDDVNETKAVNEMLNKWHNDVANYNYDDYFNAFSKEGYYIGTDATENWRQNEFKIFSKPYFDKKNTWNFTTKQRYIYFSKDQQFVWFNELLDTWMGICRGSGVLEKENGHWKIKQYVLSVTVPNSEMKKVIEIKKLKE